MYSPISAFTGPRGLPLIVDWNNHRVRELRADGTLMTVLGTGEERPGDLLGAASQFSIHHPYQFQVIGGRMYFAGYHDPRVLFVDEENIVRVLAGFGNSGDTGDGGPAQLATFFAPTGLAIAADGTAYIADELTHRIRRVRADEVIEAFAGTGEQGYAGDGGPAMTAQLNSPTRLALDLEGALIVCDSKNHVLRRVGADGIISTIAGTGRAGFSGDGGPATLAELNEPNDVKVLADGSLLVADSGNHIIRWIAPSGVIQTIAGTPTESGFGGDGGLASESKLNLPLGVDVDSEGHLWISDTYNHRVRKVQHGVSLLRSR